MVSLACASAIATPKPRCCPGLIVSKVVARATAGIAASSTAGTAGTTTGARCGVRRQPRHAHPLPQPVILLLALRLECERREQCDALTFLETVHDFGVVEVRGAEHNDARVIGLVRAIDDEDEARMCAPPRACHLGRRKLQMAAPRPRLS